MSTDLYDVIVLGAGSTGTNVAWYARHHGLTVAVVEERLVGGECSYFACIPSKSLLHPTEVVAAARRVPGAAAAVSGELDAGEVLRRRDEWTHELDDGAQASWLEELGVDLRRGTARLAGERRVEVRDEQGRVRELTATRGVVIATGSRPALPPIDGLDRTRVWTNREATQAERIPDRLLVLGGGPVGCELAQGFARLGATVTVLEMADRLLMPYEPEVGTLLGEAFEAEGISVRTGTTVDSLTRDGEDGPVTVTTAAGEELVADELLVAAGRTPNTDRLGLETVGLEPGGSLAVDDRLAVDGVAGGWLYAAGDVNGRALLTHQGKYQARIVGDVLAGRDVTAWADHTAVGQVVFTDPQVAAVGVTEAAAREAGMDVRTVRSDPNAVAGGALHGHGYGAATLVIDQRRRVVVGASFVGPGVGELLHAATVAIVGAVPLETLWHAVPAFPTTSEVWLRLLEAERGVS
ncbi:MAG: dihydrolipoyl dehydrogenase family protein [Nitriliruptoraceae bacterium]